MLCFLSVEHVLMIAQALMSSVFVVVPLDNVIIEELNETEVLIKQNYSNELLAHDFFFKLTSEKQKDMWLKSFADKVNVFQQLQIEQFPITYSTFYDVAALRASCLLSEMSEFGEVVEKSEDEEITKWELRAAPFQDLFEFALLQSQPDAAVLIIDAIMIYFRMKGISFNELYQGMKRTWKNHTIARRKGDMNAKHFDWKKRLRYFGEHVSRSYALMSLKDRDRMVRFCAKEIGESAIATMKEQLSNYVRVCNRCFFSLYLLVVKTTNLTELITMHKSISLQPNWEVPDLMYVFHFPSVFLLIIRLDDISTKSLGEQITVLEMQHHQNVSCNIHVHLSLLTIHVDKSRTSSSIK